MKITNESNKEIRLEDIKSRYALPCHLSEYYINGIFLSKHDFGMSEDKGDYNDDNIDADIASWGCINRVFERYTDDKHINKAMKVYGITREEYDLIADRLEEVLDVGMCGWCV